MFWPVLMAYLPYALVTAFTPGPNNLMALYAIAGSGWGGGKKTMLGMISGFTVVMLVCALLCFVIASWVPAVAQVMKYVGAAYICWLAWHIAFGGPSSDSQDVVSFGRAFVLQFLNPKTIMYAITIYTAYVLPGGAGAALLVAHAVALSVIGAAGMFAWGFAGTLMQRFIARHRKAFNGAMALLLLWCAVMLVL